MKKTILTTFACLGLCSISYGAVSRPNITINNFVVTARTSPSNSFSLQNVMSYIDKRGVVGLISTDIAGDPAAINCPHMLRVCDIVYSPASYYMWDATNAPAGAFALQNGKRLGWGLDWTDTTPFLASDIYFSCNSSEPANSLHYAGNIATNTDDGLALTFSPTQIGRAHV